MLGAGSEQSSARAVAARFVFCGSARVVARTSYWSRQRRGDVLRLREQHCAFWEPYFFRSITGAVPAHTP